MTVNETEVVRNRGENGASWPILSIMWEIQSMGVTLWVWPPDVSLVSGCCPSACSVVSDSLRPHGLQPARRLCPWDFPGRNAGVGCHFLLQGIFPTQGSNLSLFHLLRCRWVLYHWAIWEAQCQDDWNSESDSLCTSLVLDVLIHLPVH